MWNIRELNENQSEYEPGKWGPAKPLCYPGDGFFNRLKDAWAVFTGSAAAVKWYK
tara:strand:- start:32147 stop:32311 length:165 start_codon:yes stop_codon:yes gene_type:complete